MIDYISLHYVSSITFLLFDFGQASYGLKLEHPISRLPCFMSRLN